MNILLDANISTPELFESLGQCQFYHGRQPSVAQLRQADALIVRSTTEVNAELLQEATRLRFVGTATIGTDHLDIERMEELNICWHSAAGCNAQAVTEYVILSLVAWFKGQMAAFSGCKVAVVGYGNIGSVLVRALSRLGAEVLVVDPFKAQSSPLPGHARWAALEDTYTADVISLHTPLTNSAQSAHPTYHLIDAQYLQQFQGELIINTCRGAVIDNSALDAQLAGQDFSAILDVWEHEPTPMNDLIDKVHQASPHIAGYTLEGKVRGSYMIYQALCAHMKQEVSLPFAPLLPDISAYLATDADDAINLGKASFAQWLKQFYEIARDDAAMHALRDLPASEQGAYFDGLRKHYALRRELSAYAPLLKDALRSLPESESEPLRQLAQALAVDAQ